jgi:hypothetical protein
VCDPLLLGEALDSGTSLILFSLFLDFLSLGVEDEGEVFKSLLVEVVVVVLSCAGL